MTSGTVAPPRTFPTKEGRWDRYELDLTYKNVGQVEIDTGRWSRYYWQLIQVAGEDTVWGIHMEEGLTEMQDVDQPFVDIDTDGRVPAYQFEQREVVKTEWVPVQ